MSAPAITPEQEKWLARVKLVAEEYERVKTWRDSLIVIAHREGVSARGIADYAGLSFSQVARIVKAAR